MRVIVRSAPAAPALGEGLRLLTPEVSRWDELGSNLVALVAAAGGRPQWDARPAFAIAVQPRWDPRRSMTASLFCHAAIAFLLFNLTALLRFAGSDDHPKRAQLDSRRLQWYITSDQLPSIGAADAPEKTTQEKGAKVKETPRHSGKILHPQTMESNPDNPDNSDQSIVQPDVPKIKITQSQLLPNVVMWQDVQRPAPPVDLVKAPLRIPAELIRHTVALPEETPNLEKKLGDLKVAAAPISILSSALTVEPATTAAGNTPPTPPPAPELPPPPPDPSAVGAGAQAEAQVRKLVVLNVTPAPPKGPIEVPTGNRAGNFSTGPDGHAATPNNPPAAGPEGGASTPASAGETAVGAKRDSAGIHVPGISVLGGASPFGSPVVSGPPRPAVPSAPGATPDPSLLARPTNPTRGSYEESRNVPEPGFPPGKRVYTVFINMPNLGSSTSGSWLMRFAELQVHPNGQPQVEISAPVATHKVDPGYEPDAAREKIQGKVRLHAIIRRDGRVDTVEVLKSLDPRLDQRAITALMKWHFQPSLREGVPVDLEAVIEIPFSLPDPRYIERRP
jgi:TonB family protein